MGWVYAVSPEVERLSHYPEIIGVSSAFCIVMLAAVTARGTLRRRILGWDDAIIAVTAIWSTAFVIMAIVQTRWGLGLPLALRARSTAHHFSILSYAGKPLYFVALAGYKVALCAGYLRIIRGSGLDKYRLVIKAMAVFVILSHLTFILVTLLECLPIQRMFNPELPGHCLNFLYTQYTIVAVSIFCDVAIFLLPIPLFLNLSVHRKATLGLSFLFACGLLTTVCSIVRATYLREVGPKGKGDNSMVVLFCAIETNVGIVMSCLPFLRSFFKGMFDNRDRPTPRYQSSWPQSNQRKPSAEVEKLRFGYGTNSSIAKTMSSLSKSRTDSEKDVLLDDIYPALPEQGILKTTGYRVDEERIDGL